MKPIFAIFVALTLASCSASEPNQVPDVTPNVAVNSSTDGSAGDSPESFFSRNFSSFFQAFQDEDYGKFLEIFDQYEKEETTGKFAKEKLGMRLHAEIALESQNKSDADMNNFLSKYVGRVFEGGAKATGKVQSDERAEIGPLALSEDKKTLSVYDTLRSPKYKAIRFDYTIALSTEGEHELNDGYYYVYEGTVSSIRLVQSEDLIEVKLEISDAVLSLDPNI